MSRSHCSRGAKLVDLMSDEEILGYGSRTPPVITEEVSVSRLPSSPQLLNGTDS